MFRVVFVCNHEVEVGAPELLLEQDCSIQLEWTTKLACPPHTVVRIILRISLLFNSIFIRAKYFFYSYPLILGNVYHLNIKITKLNIT